MGEKITAGSSMSGGIFRLKTKEAGLSPGSIIHVGERRIEKPVIDMIRYSPKECTATMNLKVGESRPDLEANEVSWVTVRGLHDAALIGSLGKLWNLHPLALEDTVNTEHPPKLDEFEENICLVFKAMRYDRESRKTVTEQFSLFLEGQRVLLFQEGDLDLFTPVRSRIEKKIGRIRNMSADYLAFALLDTVVDEYYLTLEAIGEDLEQVDDRLMEGFNQDILREMHNLKKSIMNIRRLVQPLREILILLERGDTKFSHEQTSIFFRDVREHVNQILDTIEIYREMLFGMQDVYLNASSNRLNEVMKVLTIMASIFIPLTFLAGIYGMNFKHMPELEIGWAYPAVLMLMLIIASGMVVFFRFKRWL